MYLFHCVPGHCTTAADAAVDVLDPVLERSLLRETLTADNGGGDDSNRGDDRADEWCDPREAAEDDEVMMC